MWEILFQESFIIKVAVSDAQCPHSCHLTSLECYYRDVKNMIQEQLEKEVIEFGHAKYKSFCSRPCANLKSLPYLVTHKLFWPFC